MASHQSLTIHVPPGPIGIGVQQQGTNGRCVVTKTFPTTTTKTNKKPSPLLRVGDVILSLNGITLEDVEGGADAWVKLFVAFGAVDRKLIVQRAVAVANNKAGISTSLKNQKKVHLNNNDSYALSNKKQKIDTTNDSHASKMNIISLLDDTTDEEEGVSSGSEVEVVPVSSSTSWRSGAGGNLKDDRDYDDNNANNNMVGKGKNNNKGGKEDDEIAVVATKGTNALVDFPHSR